MELMSFSDEHELKLAIINVISSKQKELHLYIKELHFIYLA
jgi:hypothetical protein